MAMQTYLRMTAWGWVFFMVLLTAASCAQPGVPSGRGGVLTPPPPQAPSGGELVAEIERVDANARQIVARTPDGRMETVYFDERTQVMYRGQRYPVTALERGDLVSMRLVSTSRPGYVDLIAVQQSTQERRGTGAPPGSAGVRLPVQRIEGTVGMIDIQRGLFDVRTRDLGTLMVSLPYNPRGSDIERFRRLRSGDLVQVTGRLLNAQRFELEQFQ
jgi:hypothetical protein